MGNLKNRFKNRVKDNIELFILIGLLSIGVVFLYLASWIKGNYFVGGGDVRTQAHPFFVLLKNEWISALKEKTLPFYSWYGFLGMNLWSSKATYCMFDIYNFIGYLIPANYWVVYEILCYLKIVVSGVSFYFFAKYLFKNRRNILLISLCYGLSSYIVYFTAEPFFISFCSMVPLYLLGIEKYFEENKKILFIVSVVLLLSCNYYFFFSLSLFTPIYFLYRYYNIHSQFKGCVLSALRLIGYYVVGVAVVGVVIVPSFYYVIQNERVGNFNARLIYKDLKLYLHLIVATFVPSHTYIYGNNIYNYLSHTLKEILLYAGSVVSLLIPQAFISKDKKYRISTIILYVIMALVLFTPVGGSVSNGFSEVCFRWTYLIILMNCFTTLNILEHKKEINSKVLIITAIAEILLIAGCYLLGLDTIKATINEYKTQGIIFICAALFILINALLLRKEKSILVFVAVCVELFSFIGYKGIKCVNTSENPESFEVMTKTLAGSRYDLDYYLNNLEEGNSNEYFRVYIPEKSVYWDDSYNLNIIYGLKGLMSYDSTYAPSFNDMKSMNPEEIIEIIEWQFDIKDLGLMNYLSTKYSITLTKEEIPFENYKIIDEDYQGSMITAKNLDYQPLGSVKNTVISINEFENKYDKDTKTLSEYVICDDEEFEEIKRLVNSEASGFMYKVEYGRNYLTGLVESNKESLMTISLPYDTGWKILVNGKEVKKYKVNGGTIGIPVEEGTNNIEMYFVPEGFKLGALMTATGVIAFIVIIIVDRRKNRV